MIEVPSVQDSQQIDISQQQSYFQRLYNQKKKDLMEKSTILNLNSDDDEELYTEDMKDNTQFVSTTLNLPLTQTYYLASTNPIGFQKLLEKARRQLKRNQAKERTQVKQIVKIEDDEESSDKRTNQKIRNRVSAQISRDRKKLYVQNLERENEQYLLENKVLNEKLEYLERELEQNREKCKELYGQIVELQVREKEEYNQLYDYECMDCGSRNVSTGNKKNGRMLKYLGLSVLTIFTIVALFGNQVESNGQIESSQRILEQDLDKQQMQQKINSFTHHSNEIYPYKENDDVQRCSAPIHNYLDHYPNNEVSLQPLKQCKAQKILICPHYEQDILGWRMMTGFN